MQVKVGLERGETTNNTSLDRNKGGKVTAVAANEDTVSSQDILIGQGIIGRQGLVFMDVVSDQIGKHGSLQTQTSQQ